MVQGRITGVPPHARVPDDDEQVEADRAAVMEEEHEYNYDVTFTNEDGTEFTEAVPRSEIFALHRPKGAHSTESRMAEPNTFRPTTEAGDDANSVLVGSTTITLKELVKSGGMIGFRNVNICQNRSEIFVKFQIN